MNPLLAVDKLSVSFKTSHGTITAVHQLSFILQAGETLALVGESGCGKSVTALAIMGLLPSIGQVEEGHIWFQEKDLLTLSPKALNQVRGKGIGMIFQDPMSALNPTMTVGHQIYEAAHSKSQVLELLHLVGFSDPEKRVSQYPHELSGGMRQRVMIAIALAASPKILIADEPTTALDVTVQAQILELLKEIQKKTGTSLLLITHDLGIVAGIADQVCVMYGGEIIEKASVYKLYQSPQHPYTQGLLHSIPRLGQDRHEKLFSIPGHPPSLLHKPEGCTFWPRCPLAMKICQKERPVLKTIRDSQEVACWDKERPV